MREHVQPLIDDEQRHIQDLERELVQRRKFVNMLCEKGGMPALYPDVEERSRGVGPVRADEYYGQPLATAIRMVLDRRQSANLGPASVGEIYDSLNAGGYKFEAKTDDYAKRGLYSALTKNVAMFHRLPNNLYGLTSWYPNVRVQKPKKASEVAPSEIDPLNTDEAAELAMITTTDQEDSVSVARKPR